MDHSKRKSLRILYGPYLQLSKKYLSPLPALRNLSYSLLGSGGFIDRLPSTGCDIVGVDWSVDMADARKRVGYDVAVQVFPKLFLYFTLKHIDNFISCTLQIILKLLFW